MQLRSHKKPTKDQLVSQIRQAMSLSYDCNDTHLVNYDHLITYFELCMLYIQYFDDSDAFRVRLQNEITLAISDHRAKKFHRQLRHFQQLLLF